MGLQLTLRTIRWSLTQRGFFGTLRAVPAALGRTRRGYVAPTHPFDERHGTETGGVLGGGSLASGHKHDVYITAYAGVPPFRLNAALDRWAQTLDGESLEDFSFVDLGCGKGRALLLASERSFREVLGVELNPGLVAIAQENVRRWAALGLGKAPITVTRGDAAGLRCPDGSCLVFLYNPFGPEVVRMVLERLHDHVLATGARIDLLFQNESPEMPMRDDPGLRLVWSARLPLLGEDGPAEPVASSEDVTSLYRLLR